MHFDGGLVFLCLGIFDRLLFFEVDVALGSAGFEGFGLMIIEKNLFFVIFVL